MPNWCENQVHIYGPKQDRQRLLDAATNSDGVVAFCQNIIPMPEHMTETRTLENGETFSVFADGGHNWQYDNWGTKWGDCDGDATNEDLVLNLAYNSPWGPITRAWQTISKQYPTLVFVENYNEPGMCFMGGTRIVNGEVVAQHYIEDNEYPDLGNYEKDGDYDYSAYYDEVDQKREAIEVIVDISYNDIRRLAGETVTETVSASAEEDANV